MKLKVLRSPRAPAAVLMERDAELLRDLAPDGDPILHLYEWDGDSATFGYFLKPEDYLDLDAAERRGLTLARRPTGGGITFHVWDYAFSLLIPAEHPEFSVNTLQNYQLVNSLVGKTVAQFCPMDGAFSLIEQEPPPLDPACCQFCMAKPTMYDVMLGDQKVGGGAQRRKRQGLLHQGTIALSPPDLDYLREVLLPDNRVFEAMAQQSRALLEWPATPQERADLGELLAATLDAMLSLDSRKVPAS